MGRKKRIRNDMRTECIEAPGYGIDYKLKPGKHIPEALPMRTLCELSKKSPGSGRGGSRPF
jgi:hypothetical protein